MLFAIAPACDIPVASSELECRANLVRVCQSKPEKDRKPNPKVGGRKPSLKPAPKTLKEALKPNVLYCKPQTLKGCNCCVAKPCVPKP